MDIVKDDSQVEEQAVKFDPSKAYRWQPETRFVLNGTEFGNALNTLRALLEISQLAGVAYQALEQKLKDAVETGEAIEIEPPQQNQ